MTTTNIRARKPKMTPPPGSCDCHIHIFGSRDRYPLAADAAYRPAEASVERYRDLLARLGTERVVVVQPSVYGTDNRCTLDAIAALGPQARGIAVILPDASDAELARLHDTGIRGLRFSLTVKNAMHPRDLNRVSQRIAPLGWHIQLRSTHHDLPDLEPILNELPVDVCIDHMSSIPPAEGTRHPAFETLMRLVSSGRVWVKLSAPYQLSRKGPPRYADMAEQARRLIAAAAQRMVWGTNWPHPQASEQPPDDADLLDVLLDWADDEVTRRAILVENAATLYDFNNGS